MNLRFGPDRQCADGRAPSPRPTPASLRRGSAASPTEGELYIAHFLGATGASRLIGLADTSPHAARPRFSRARRAPIRRSSTTGAATPAAPARSIALLVGPLRCGARRAGEHRRRSSRTRATVRPAVPARSRPTRAGLTETYAAAARLSPVAASRRRRPGVPRPVPQQRRPEPVAPAGEFALDLAAAPDGRAGAAAPHAGRSRGACRHACAEPRAGAPSRLRRASSLFQDQRARRAGAVSRPGLSALRLGNLSKDLC